MTYTELLQKIRDYTEVGSTVLSDTICNGLINDARVNQCRLSTANRLSRTIPTDFDDLKVASFAETFFDD